MLIDICDSARPRLYRENCFIAEVVSYISDRINDDASASECIKRILCWNPPGGARRGDRTKAEMIADYNTLAVFVEQYQQMSLKAVTPSSPGLLEDGKAIWKGSHNPILR